MWVRYTGPRATVEPYGILTTGEDLRIADGDYDAAIFTKRNNQPKLATAEQFPCEQRGDQIGARPIGSCRNGSRIESVYTCELYGRCAMRSCGKGIAICLGCPERETDAAGT